MNTQDSMKIAWRFYVSETGRWRWEQLDEDRVVVARSRNSYDGYDACVAAAQNIGYVFKSAPEKLRYTPTLHGRAAAVRSTSGKHG
jgi:hypothetical protein